MRVLFADDDYDIRQVVHSMFSIAGHDVRLVENGEEAVSAFAQGEFDVVVLDYDMPVLDGLGALRAIRGAAGGAEVPIVFFTAHYEFGLEERAVNEGATLLVHKPFVAGDFVALLEQIVRD